MGIVILFWAVVGTVAAGIGALVLRSATALLTRRVTEGRRNVMLAATGFPLVASRGGAAVFVFQGTINVSVFHRDPGIGDAWMCPLPNGYALLMIDTADDGWVYDPGTQPAPGGVGEQEDAIPGVRVLQGWDRYIAA